MQSCLQPCSLPQSARRACLATRNQGGLASRGAFRTGLLKESSLRTHLPQGKRGHPIVFPPNCRRNGDGVTLSLTRVTTSVKRRARQDGQNTRARSTSSQNGRLTRFIGFSFEELPLRLLDLGIYVIIQSHLIHLSVFVCFCIQAVLHRSFHMEL